MMVIVMTLAVTITRRDDVVDEDLTWQFSFWFENHHLQIAEHKIVIMLAVAILAAVICQSILNVSN